MLSDEEKKEYEQLKSLLYQGTISQYGKRKLINIIEKQSKEIEEQEDFIKKLQATKDRLDKYDKENTLIIEKQQKEIEELKEKNEYLPSWVNRKYISKDKIKAEIEELEKMNIHEFETMNVLEVLQLLLEKE